MSGIYFQPHCVVLYLPATNKFFYCIGCGPVCIFPLLSCPINDWKFIATEIQPDCIKYAQENVARNNLSDKIKGKNIVTVY